MSVMNDYEEDLIKKDTEINNLMKLTKSLYSK